MLSGAAVQADRRSKETSSSLTTSVLCRAQPKCQHYFRCPVYRSSRTHEVLGREAGPDDVEEGNLRLAAIGRKVGAADYIAAVAGQQRWSRQMLAWWQPHGFDLLVTPVIAGPPPPIGYLAGPEGGRRVRELLLFTAQFNVTGQPAISLPLHRTSDGLPVGVQLVAAHAREDVLVRVAAQLEEAAPWPTCASLS